MNYRNTYAAEVAIIIAAIYTTFGIVSSMAARGVTANKKPSLPSVPTVGTVHGWVFEEPEDAPDLTKKPLPHMFVWRTNSKDEPLTQYNLCAVTDNNGNFKTCGSGWYSYKFEGPFLDVYFSKPPFGELLAVLPGDAEIRDSVTQETVAVYKEFEQEKILQGYNLVNPVWSAAPGTLEFHELMVFYHYHQLRQWYKDIAKSIETLSGQPDNVYHAAFDITTNYIITTKTYALEHCRGSVPMHKSWS